MHKITDLKAGDFIDLENWFKEISSEQYDNIQNFYLLLLGRNPDSEEETVTVIQNFVEQKTEIVETYTWIYDPPQMPTDAEQREPTIGDEYRKEFAEDYGSYVEIIYLLCIQFGYRPNEVLQMNCGEFLYWGEYLLRKRWCEAIK